MSRVSMGPALWLNHPQWRLRRSLASRVTLLTTLAVGLTVAILSLVAYFTVRVQMQASMDATLLERARQTAQAPTLSIQGSGRVPAWALVATDLRIAIVNTQGEIYLPGQMGFFPDVGRAERAVAAGRSRHSIRTAAVGDLRFRLAAVPYDRGEAVVLAQSLSSQQQVLKRLGAVTIGFGVAGVIAAGFAGWGVARSGLRPVRRLTRSVEQIARTEDLTPLPVEGDDEIARLATAFNGMLTALAASRDRERQLVADAGHELRTPLTSLRTNIELLTQSMDPEVAARMPQEAREELLADVRAQIVELTTLVGDLVELARDDVPAHVIGQVEMHTALENAVTRVRRRAPGITLELDNGSWFVDGEAASIERALTNLLDNAAKWSPPGGTVRVRLDAGTVTVDDEGPGIAEEDLPHVFDRFYRAESARSMPGSGLGLAIVSQVAERHAGSVTASQSPYGGARMTFRIPGAATPKPPAPPTPPTAPRTGQGRR